MRSLILPFILACLLGLAGCEKPPVAPAQTGEEQPPLTFTGFTARGTHGATLDWEANADTAQVYSKRQLARVQSVRIRYFQKGKLVSVAKADTADLGTETHDILASGEVELRAQNGVTLYCDRLKWDHKRQRVSSDGAVRVVRKGSVLTGRGFSADRDLEDVVVREDVRIEASSITDAREQAKDLQDRKPVPPSEEDQP